MRFAGSTNQVWANSLNRRNAFRAVAGFLAGSPLLRSQQDPFRDHSRIPGLKELVTAFDFEPVAYAKVPRYNYDYTAYGTDSEFTLRRNREAFDWVELIPNRVLDVGPDPDGNQDSWHPDGFPHHGVAFRRPQHAAPGWRTGNLSGRHRRIQYSVHCE